MKKIIFYGLVALFVVQFVSAGVTNPQPTELELMKTESGRFKFQIQTITNPSSILCTYSLEGDSPLIVEFDDDEVLVEANTKKYVYGTVTVPENIEQKISFDTQGYMVFEENFCVSCGSADGIAGASVQINTCDLPITVRVVSQRTRDNMYVPPKPLPAPELPVPGIIIVSLIIVVIAIIASYVYVYRRRKPKPTRRKRRK